MKFLKQSTAVTPKVGPFLDSTDGVTAETGLTLSQSDCILFKNHGAGAQKNDTNAATHDTGGMYGVPLNTTDTNTVGPLQLLISESGALPVWETWYVLPANVFDSLQGTDLLDISLVQMNGSTTPVTNIAASALGIVRGTSDNTGFTGTPTQFEASDITEATADHYKGRVIVFTGGALAGQAGLISVYALSGGRGHFTFSATLTEAVPNGSTFVIV
jgi:hypothetical protein